MGETLVVTQRFEWGLIRCNTSQRMVINLTTIHIQNVSYQGCLLCLNSLKLF